MPLILTGGTSPLHFFWRFDMSKFNTFKTGDVVFGAFMGSNGAVLKHHSVVLQSSKDALVLAYTTSLKERSSSPQVFTQEDMKLAGWAKPCRWDASLISIVPSDQVVKKGSVTASTISRITQAVARAKASRSLVCTVLETAQLETA